MILNRIYKSPNLKKIAALQFIAFLLSSAFLGAKQNNLLDSAAIYHQNGKYTVSSDFYNQWLGLNSDKKDSIYIEVLLNVSEIERIDYENNKALKNIYEAKKLSSEKGFRSLYVKSSILLADFYIQMERFDDAKLIFDEFNSETELFTPFLQCKFYHRKAYYFNQMAFFIKEKRFYDSAQFYSQKALVIASKQKDNYALATIFNEMGSISERQGDFVNALVLYNKSCAMYKPLSLRDFSNAYFNKAKVYVTLNQFDSAIYYLNQNLKTIDHTNWHEIKISIYTNLSLCYFAQKDTLNGYKYKEMKCSEYYDLQSIVHGKQLEEMLIENQLAQKNDQIRMNEISIDQGAMEKKRLFQLLFLLGLILLLSILFFILVQKKNKNLRELLNVKEILLKEVNHRVKNNLEIMGSLLELESGRIGMKSPVKSLTDSASRLRAIATMHSSFYKNEEYDKIAIETLVANIIEIYQGSSIEGAKVSAEIHCDHIMILHEKAIPIGLMLNELVANSYQHALSKNDPLKIIIDIKMGKKELKINYTDNGPGFNSEKTNGKTMGLFIIESMAKQLGAKYSLNSKDGVMYSFVISLD